MFPVEDEDGDQDLKPNGNQDGDPEVVEQERRIDAQLLNRDDDDSDLDFTPDAAGTTVYDEDSDDGFQYSELVIGGESDSEEELVVLRTLTPPPDLPEADGPRPGTCGADGGRTVSGDYCNNAPVADSSRCRWHS